MYKYAHTCIYIHISCPHTYAHTHIYTHAYKMYIWTHASTSETTARQRLHGQPNLTPRSSALLPVRITTVRRPDHIRLSGGSQSTQSTPAPSLAMAPRNEVIFLPFWRGLSNYDNYDSIWNSQLWFNLKQSNSHCEYILSLSCPWHFFSDGTVEEKNTGRDKLMRKDRDLLASAAKFPYILSYATDGSRLFQIATLRFVAYYKRFSLITGSCLSCIYICIYIYIHMRIYIYIYIKIYIYMYMYI